MSTYTLEVSKGPKITNVWVLEDGTRTKSVRVAPARLRVDGAQRAAVSWSSLSVVNPKLAESYAKAIERAAALAKESDKRPEGFAPLYAYLGLAVKVEADLTPEQQEEFSRCHPNDQERGLFLYSGAEYDWDLNEPVYNLGCGARVFYRVPESKIRVREEVTA